jgi:lipopolysaccharide export system permease protein
MILPLYFTRRFLGLVLRVLLGFFALLVLIDAAEQLRRLSDQGLGLLGALRLSALNTPATLYAILPLIVLLAAIALFLALAKSSELVVVRAAGQSGLRFLAAPVLAALLLGLFAVAVMNPLVAATSKRYDQLWSDQARGGEKALSVTEEGVWLRQGDAEGQTVIHAARATGDGTTLFGATFLTFDPEGRPLRRIEAREAVLEPGAWVLTGAKDWPLDADNPEQQSRLAADGARLASDLTAEGIRDSFGTPSAIPFWDLPGYIADLERAGFSARQHRVWFQMELALPVMLAAMVLVAAGFTMRHARFGQTGQMVLMALLSGFVIFFLRNFGQILGESGQIPVALAAWSPPVAAVLMALGLLLHLEDG